MLIFLVTLGRIGLVLIKDRSKTQFLLLFLPLNCLSPKLQCLLSGFVLVSLGLVPEPKGQMAEKGEHKKGPGSTSPQRAPHHVQRGAHGSGGDRAS